MRLITGKDGVVRGAEIDLSGNKGKTRMQRPLQWFYPLEISHPCIKDDDQGNGVRNPPPPPQEEQLQLIQTGKDRC